MTAAATLLRPRRFADVVGQDHIKPVLRAMVVHGNPPPAMLFTGSRGTGKTTCGRILAAALNCENPVSGDACTTCFSCLDVQTGSSMSVVEVDAASHGLVDDIRSLRESVAVSHAGKWRVVLLDEAHSMSKEAFNALLKTLEEPPPGTVFVLLTTEPHKIIPTVRSRSMLFEFRRLSLTEIAARLEDIDTDDEGLEGKRPVIEEQVFALIADRADGGMRDAIMLFDQARRAGVWKVGQLADLFGWEDHSEALYVAALDTDHATLHRVADAVFRQSGDASGMVRDLTLYTRDLLVLRSGGEIRHFGEQEAMAAMASRIPTARLVAVMRVMWDAEQRLRAEGADQRSALALVVAMFADALMPEVVSVTAHPEGGGASGSMQTEHEVQKRLTLTEMIEQAQEAMSTTTR